MLNKQIKWNEISIIYIYNFSIKIILASNDFHRESAEFRFDRASFVNDSADAGVLSNEHFADDVLVGERTITEVEVGDVADGLERGRDVADVLGEDFPQDLVE